MVMKNDDVYFTSLSTNPDREIPIKDQDLVPNVPVKLDALCGVEVRGKSLARF